MLRLNIHARYPDEEAIRKAAALIMEGAVAVYPTETVYGMAVACGNAKALERLFAIKGRQDSHPVLMLVESMEQVGTLAASIPDEAHEIARAWWPGPLTLLFAARPGLSPYLAGASGKIACRMSSSAVAHRLASFVGCPITATSANVSGGPSASRVEDIPRELLEQVDVLIDAGPTPGEPASTLLDVSGRPFKIVREGAIPATELVP